jgi:hypothetical protein
MSASTTTVAKPTTKRYFYKTTQVYSANNLTLSKSLFTKDDGTVIAAGSAFTTATASNGYYMLFINAVLQQSSLYTVSEAGGKLNITASAGSTIPRSELITLVVTNFAPESTPTVTG